MSHTVETQNKEIGEEREKEPLMVHDPKKWDDVWLWIEASRGKTPTTLRVAYTVLVVV
jgi:hypothetical protein